MQPTPEQLAVLRHVLTRYLARFIFRDLEETTSVAVLGVMKALAKGRWDATRYPSFSRWACLTGRSAVLDRQRATGLNTRRESGRRKAGLPVEWKTQVSDEALAGVGVSDPLAADDTQTFLIACLQKLDSIDQFVLWQCDALDSGLKPVADFLDLTESRVCQLRERARGRLRALFESPDLQ